MLSFFRDGFIRDYSILMLVTILVGTVFSSGVAWLIDSYFGDTINDMIGEYGEYDVILHVREEAKQAAIRELVRLGDTQFPGAEVSETLTIAGQANLFFGFPEEFKTREVLEAIPGIFSGIPGLNGYTVILEPSILIRGVHPSVREELTEEIQRIPGVAFAFRDGANMIVVLETMEQSRFVTTAVKDALAAYQILELRFPMGFEVDTQQVGRQLMGVVDRHFDVARTTNVTSAEYGEDLDAFLKTLVEMRGFLLSYASKVRIEADPNVHLIVGEQLVLQGTGSASPEPGSLLDESQVTVEILDVQGAQAEGMIIKGSISEATDTLVQSAYRLRSGGEIGDAVATVALENDRYRLAYTIDESLRLLGELEDLATEASLAVDNADALLITFQEAVMQLEVLQIQMRQLTDGLAQGSSQSAGEQILVSLLLNGLLKNITQASVGDGEGPALETLESLDIEAMRQSLHSISGQIGNVQGIDVYAIVEQIERLRDSLPQLEDEDIGQSIRLINTYLAGQVIPGERVQVLVSGGVVDEKRLEPIIQAELDNPYVHAYSASVGMVNPDARSELFRVLKEIRATIAGMLAVMFTMTALVLDHATVFSTLKRLAHRRRHRHSVMALGAVVGMIVLVSTYLLSGAEIPFIGFEVIAVVGMLLGGATVVLAERFSPIHAHEIMAGQALGLTNVQIMREIVIPASRPGLMNALNRWKQRF